MKIYKTHIHQKNRYEPITVFITDNRDKMMDEIRNERKFHRVTFDRIYDAFVDIWKDEKSSN